MIRLIGAWKKTANLLRNLDVRYAAAANKAVMKEAHYLRGQMIKNLVSGGQLAGAPFKPLSPNTLIIRSFKGFGGGKPLIVTGALMRAISVVKVDGGVFVGVKRATGGNGKGGANLAAVHEYGSRTYQIRITDKMRRFLAAAMAHGGRRLGQNGPGKGAGVITIRIPPRPFIGPVLDRFAQPNDVRDRFWNNMAAELGGDIGRP